jgi:hypothetical protein
MATKNMAYDHPAYTARLAVSGGEAGGAATTQYGKFAAFTKMQAMSAQVTVTTAGTAAGHLLSVLQISGTATTTLATTTLGTAAAGTTTNVALSTAAGGVSLAQGDILDVVTGADAAGKAAVSYELLVQPLANVTA